MAIIRISSSDSISKVLAKTGNSNYAYTSDGKYCVRDSSIYETSGFGKARVKGMQVDLTKEARAWEITLQELMSMAPRDIESTFMGRGTEWYVSAVWTGVDSSRFFNPYANYSLPRASFSDVLDARRVNLQQVAGAVVNEAIAALNENNWRELPTEDGLTYAFQPPYPSKKVERGVLDANSKQYPNHYFIKVGHIFFIGPKYVEATKGILRGRLLARAEDLLPTNTYSVANYKFKSLKAAYAYAEESLEFVRATSNLGHLVLVRDPNSKALSPVVRSRAVPLLTRYKGMYYKGKGNEAVFTFPSGANSSRFEKDLRDALPNLEVKHI